MGCRSCRRRAAWLYVEHSGWIIRCLACACRMRWVSALSSEGSAFSRSTAFENAAPVRVRTDVVNEPSTIGPKPGKAEVLRYSCLAYGQDTKYPSVNGWSWVWLDRSTTLTSGPVGRAVEGVEKVSTCLIVRKAHPL